MYFYGYFPKYIDHIDNNPLNNKIENLRECVPTQNLRNTRKIKKGHSKYKGVTWDNRKNKWVSRIKTIDKRLHLGYYLTDVEAAIAYNNAAIKYFGEFANINEIED